MTVGAQRAAIEQLAQAVLDCRARMPDSSPAALYDPDLMKKPLRQAHRALDRAVERLYREAAFKTERQRVEFLFAAYEAALANA